MAVAGESQRSFESTLRSAQSSMVFSETLSLAMDSFRASKVRFLLTMLGMIIGSASIVLVVTVGLTGRQYALKTLSSIGPNMVEMQYSGGATVGPDNTSTPDYMTKEDEAAVTAQVPGIAYSSPMLETHTPGKHRQWQHQRRDDAWRIATVQGRAQSRGVERAILRRPGCGGARKSGSHGGTAGQEDVRVGRGCHRPHPQPEQHSRADHRCFQRTYSDLRTVRDQRPRPSFCRIRLRVTFTGTDTVKEIFFTMAGCEKTFRLRASTHSCDMIRSRHRATSSYNAMTMVAILDTMDEGRRTSLTYVLTAAAFITLVVSVA